MKNNKWMQREVGSREIIFNFPFWNIKNFKQKANILGMAVG